MPHHSIVRDSATPAFTLDLMQSLLRHVYVENHRRTNTPARFAPSKHPFDDDNDDDLMDFPDTPEDVPTLPSYQTTAADNLGPEEIAEWQSRGIDPYATAADGTNRLQQPKLPLTRLIFAARFAAIFNTPEMARSLVSPQAVTLLSIPDDAERELFFEMFPDILEQTAQALDEAGIHLHGIAVAELPNVQAASSHRGRKEFNDKVDRLIAKGNNVIVVARTRDDLPRSGQLLCTRTATLPPVTGDMVIEILRQTHSITGKLSDVAIRGRFPNDAAFQELPMPLVKSAFAEQTTLEVADRLLALTRRLGTGKVARGPSLDAIYLPPQAQQDMKHLLSDLGQWQAGNLPWSEVTSSVLLYGPPGTGKTLLAQALAGSAGIPLIATSYGICQKAGHQGDFLRTLSESVENAIACAPCVFFIDELDSFSKRSVSHRNSGYVAAIVNALLEHLTKLNDTAGVIVLGATNLPENVDPAIIRPGRFDRHTALENPNRAGIKRICEIELGASAQDLDLATVADRLLGMSGAQVAAVVRDARGNARHSNTTLCNQHLHAAVDHVAPEGRQEDLHRIAIHEAGHAVVAHILGLPLPDMVRITARGGAYLGKIPFAATKKNVCDQIAVTLGGRAAEAVLLGSVSNGAESDLEQATEIAFKARYSWGLYPNNLLSLSSVKLTHLDPLAPLGSVVNSDIRGHYLRAKEIVEDNVKLVERVAAALLEQREIDGDALAEVLAAHNITNSDRPTEALIG
ncbi:AAA family ATPase [Sulfitobacter sp. S223]|uniref:AAA family ATPase n=1 Tax=Sulfitobacter sp. S223 TaxID=2867023 RepID=UPI0021A733EB|nr:AAA family ATPase [Sulfitobacter sp. S223]UWR27917.1 AAA family ATPase [Sulfitobacter sp. S223]